MNARMAVLEQRHNETKDIKHAMMQKFLTNRTRVV